METFLAARKDGAHASRVVLHFFTGKLCPLFLSAAQLRLVRQGRLTCFGYLLVPWPPTSLSSLHIRSQQESGRDSGTETPGL